MARKKLKPGSTFTKRVTRGTNKGDLTRFKVAPGGKPYPVAVLDDVGPRSTLRNNPGVKFGRARRKTRRKVRKTRRR